MALRGYKPKHKKAAWTEAFPEQTRPDPKAATAPKRPRKRIPRVSKRNRKNFDAYAREATAFKKANSSCEICSGKTEDVHHRKGRGPYLRDQSTWMAVCRRCHDWIHEHPAEAKEKGWLESRL